VEPARSILESLACEIVAGSPVEERAMLAWPLACGSPVATKTKALCCEGGTLTIQVPDQAWRRQLDMLSQQYLFAIRSLAGDQVRKIAFVAEQTGEKAR
jgi:predicted nucleic acid-binding Zn ribbon protein